MSNVEIQEIIGKYFDRIFDMPVFTEQSLLNLVNPIIEKSLNDLQLEEYQVKDLLEQIKENNGVLIRYFNGEFTTIRKIKSFDNILRKNLSKIKRDVYLPDVILMSLIESTKYQLFDFIRKNQEQLSISPTDLERNDPFFITYGIAQIKRKVEVLLNSLPEKDYDILYELFPNLEFINKYELNQGETYNDLPKFNKGYSDIYESVEKKNRIAHYLLLNRYFASSSLDKSIENVISQDLKDEVLNQFNKEIIDKATAIETLKKIFPEGESNFKLRKLSLNWILRKVMEPNVNVGYNIVWGMSFVAKYFSKNIDGIFDLEEKRKAAFLIWNYLSTKNSKKEILVALIKETDNSDAFADNALFYSINDKRTPRNVNLSPELKSKIAIEYILRIERKIKKYGSIFNLDGFEEPVSAIWRWYQSIDYLISTKIEYKCNINFSEYIEKEIRSNVDNYLKIFNYYLIQDFDDEPANFRPEETFGILDIKRLLNITDDFIKDGSLEKKLSKAKYRAVKKWRESHSGDIV